MLAHEPWSEEETAFLEINDPAVKNDPKALQAALNRNNTAHMVQCFAEAFIQAKGPMKMFVLRAEGGELVGFLVGGPSKDNEDVAEVYAMHVIPAYSHYAEFHTLLWRAFSLWAQRVSWKEEDKTKTAGSTDDVPSVKRYKQAQACLYEYHPAVLRFFCKHPLMKLSEDHPDIAAWDAKGYVINCIIAHAFSICTRRVLMWCFVGQCDV